MKLQRFRKTEKEREREGERERERERERADTIRHEFGTIFSFSNF